MWPIAAMLCFILTVPIKEQKAIRTTEPISLKALAAGAKFVWQNQLILAAITLDMFAVLLGGA